MNKEQIINQIDFNKTRLNTDIYFSGKYFADKNIITKLITSIKRNKRYNQVELYNMSCHIKEKSKILRNPISRQINNLRLSTTFVMGRRNAK